MTHDRCRLVLAALAKVGLTVGLLSAPLSLADARRPRSVIKHVSALGDWRLRIARDAFSGEIACRLSDRRHRVIYTSGALGFAFKRRFHTLAAIIKIDDGTPRRWADNIPELMRLGAPIDGTSLDNPTDGMVWVPARLLDDANRIAIEPVAGQRPVVVHLRGFAGLREIARSQGCTPEGRFIR